MHPLLVITKTTMQRKQISADIASVLYLTEGSKDDIVENLIKYDVYPSAQYCSLKYKPEVI